MRDNDIINLAIVAFLIGALFSFFIGLVVSSKGWESLAIEHKAAYYHPETGEFTWKGEGSSDE